MTLRFDPEGIERFKAEIRGIPGYPAGENLPIREMIFESGALWRLPDLLLVAGMKANQPLSIVMDRTSMQREGVDLKSLILEQLRNAGWQVDVIGQLAASIPDPCTGRPVGFSGVPAGRMGCRLVMLRHPSRYAATFGS